MEFEFDIEDIFHQDQEGFVVLTGKELSSWKGFSSYTAGVKFEQGRKLFDKRNLDPFDKIAIVLDRIGAASSAVQGIPQTITTMARFAGSDQRIYLKLGSGKIEGMLKVGKKELFYRDRMGKCISMSPLCVLDFYVHDSIQRKGIGKLLFLKMLLSEDTIPNKLAYDRPSHKLLLFLKKHFTLSRYISQNNNFVIYDDYFESQYRLTDQILDELESLQGLNPAQGKNPQQDWKEPQSKHTNSNKQPSDSRGYVYPISPEEDWVGGKKGRTKGDFHPEMVYGGGQRQQQPKFAEPPQRTVFPPSDNTPYQPRQTQHTKPSNYPQEQHPSAQEYRKMAATLDKFENKEKWLPDVAGINRNGFVDLKSKKNELKIAEIDANIQRTEMELERVRREMESTMSSIGNSKTGNTNPYRNTMYTTTNKLYGPKW